MKPVWIVAGALALTSCGGEPNTPDAAPTMNPVDDLSPAPEPTTTASLTTKTTTPATTPYPIEACKAAIGSIMGRDPKTIRGKKLADGLIHVSYIRPDDGKRWQARCRIDSGDHLTWAAFDAFGDGQQGRWRTEDEVVFTVVGKNMTIRQSTGGELVSEDTYSLSKLK